MHKVTVILSSDDGTSDAHPNSHQYPIGALRQSSSYLDAMLSRRWSESLEDESDDESAYPVVDLSRLGLDPDACTAVLQFMVSRYYYHVPSGDAKVGRCNDSTQDKQRLEEAIRNEAETKIRKVTLEDIKVLLWSKGDDTIDRGRFQWDEDEKTVDWGAGLLNAQKNENEQSMHCISSQSDHSDEVTLYQAIDYLHLQPHDEIMSKLWAMKIVHCPCFLEDALITQDLIGSRSDGEEVEMYLKRIPSWSGWRNIEARMWRFLVCMFICRMLVYDKDREADNEKYGDLAVAQIRARNYRKGLETYDALNQLSYVCSGIGEDPLLLLREMVSCGLLNKKDSAYWQTPLDNQVAALWEFLDC